MNTPLPLYKRATVSKMLINAIRALNSCILIVAITNTTHIRSNHTRFLSALFCAGNAERIILITRVETLF